MADLNGDTLSDLFGDGRSDVFLYDPASGVYHHAMSVPNGFSYGVGQWAAGLQPIAAE